jgi:hypothetical protein
MGARMRRLVFSALLLAVTACSGTQTAAQSSPQTPDQVVAEVGGRKITLKELDEKWQAVDPGEQARLTQLLYQNRRNVLDQLMGDLLIDEAAKAADRTPEVFLKEELAKRAQPVSDAEIQRFYQENKDRAQGRTAEQLRGPITEYLQSQRQQQARAQLVDDLKKKKGGAVRVMLDPPRKSVEVAADDPSMGPAGAPVTMVEFSDYQ